MKGDRFQKIGDSILDVNRIESLEWVDIASSVFLRIVMFSGHTHEFTVKEDKAEELFKGLFEMLGIPLKEDSE